MSDARTDDRLAPLVVPLPDWVAAVLAEVPGVEGGLATDEARVRLAVRLARENVERGTGGPFGAVVFDDDTGAVVGVGINSVRRLGNSVLHAEIVSLMMAQRAVGTHALGQLPGRRFMLASSCDPCAMCLGAVLWSGVHRVVCAATREDAMAIGFDEGPVFPESLAYLAARGVTTVHGVLRDEGRAVLARYVALGGPVYNR